jgi:hypothetical protein
MDTIPNLPKTREEYEELHAAQVKIYNEHVKELNDMTDSQIDELIAKDQCPYKPETMKYMPIGMHHCPLCMEMVVAGLPHVRQSDLPPFTDEELTELSEAAGDVDQVDLEEGKHL